MATHVADKSRTDGKGDNECAAPQIIVLRGPTEDAQKRPSRYPTLAHISPPKSVSPLRMSALR